MKYASAAGAVLAATSQAGATPVVTDVFTEYGSGQSRAIDLDNDGTSEFEIEARPFGFVGPIPTGPEVTLIFSAPLVRFVWDTNAIAALTSGTPISSASSFGGRSSLLKPSAGPPFGVPGNWPNDLNQPRYVGVEFPTSSATHYGWALVSAAVVADTPSFRLYQYAYESEAETSITTPEYAAFATPEPSTFGLLALGAAGVAALRLRRSR